MRRLSCSALLAAVLLVAAAAPARPADGAQTLWREKRRLEAETSLAATPKPYFVLDLEHRRVELRTRAMVLFGIQVLEQGTWGRRVAIGPTAVERRDALARPAVQAGSEKSEATLDQQLLELSDMPTSYRVGLTGDVEVEVLGLAEGRWPRWRQRARIWGWHLTRPLVTLRQRRVRRETTQIFLVLQPEEAQRLYWTLFEGLDGILIPPP